MLAAGPLPAAARRVAAAWRWSCGWPGPRTADGRIGRVPGGAPARADARGLLVVTAPPRSPRWPAGSGGARPGRPGDRPARNRDRLPGRADRRGRRPRRRPRRRWRQRSRRAGATARRDRRPRCRRRHRDAGARRRAHAPPVRRLARGRDRAAGAGRDLPRDPRGRRRASSPRSRRRGRPPSAGSPRPRPALAGPDARARGRRRSRRSRATGSTPATELRLLRGGRPAGGRRPRRRGADLPRRPRGAARGPGGAPGDPDAATEAYVAAVIGEQLPAVAAQGIARSCDVFCEAGVFTADQARRILLAARALGLDIRLHADELAPSGGAELAAELGALSADHLGRRRRRGSRPGVAAAGGAPGRRGAPADRALVPGARRRRAGARADRGRDPGRARARDFNPGTSPVDEPAARHDRPRC